jgi:5-methylcytosine-specific restriction enzyme A
MDRRRDRDDPCRALYKTARWQRLRLVTFLRDLYTCQRPECGRLEGDTSQLVCDHIEPHNGDIEKFWAGPFQTLCKRCHDRDKQRIEHAARKNPWRS